ncbi:HAD-IIB family hydrolase [Schaalia vaccimaxillae]|uniref:HAD-IIB family hydrolase n=1 Tax=Schaalia vaccimaxillae TaxID=183916 RepID=UPI00047DD272|nr:HAD-IIB family hydrolase [Schaalia vaccimaxillae]
MQLVAFDLDDTLAPSKSALPELMATRLRSLLDRVHVCIISGGQIAQFRSQVLEHIEASEDQLSRLHLMPTCGTRYLRYEDGHWNEVYAHDLPVDLRHAACQSLERHARRLDLWEDNPWGDIIEDRGSQITFSALGQEAPLEAKQAWDPDGTKKAALRDAVAADLPQLDVRGGGSTSVDITERGIDKAYGMAKLVEHTGIDAHRMLFIGDRLDPQGNDYPVKAAGYPTREVSDWQECAAVIAELINDASLGSI